MFAHSRFSRGTVTGGKLRLRPHRFTASLFTLFVGAACADSTTPASPPSVVPSSSELRAFAADLEMSVTKAGVRSTARSRLERREVAAGQWVTRITRSLNPGATATSNEKTLVTTVEMADDGSVRAFGADGTKIPVESFANFRPAMGKPGAAQRPLPAFPQNPGQRRRSADGAAWFDNMVVTPRSAERTAARLERSMMKASDVRGARRFVYSGKVQAEILVDPVTGAILEETTSGPTGRMMHAKHSYTRVQGGELVRSFSRIEYGPSGDPNSVVVESTLRNITLTPRTAQ
jgi:hypothetical protein